MSKFFLVFLCGYTPSPLATCAAQIHTTLCGQFVIIFSCCHLRPHNVSCQRARLWRGVLSSRVTVVVVLSAMSKFFLVFLCGDAPSPLATCAAQIHTTLCGQFLLSMFALSCDRARGALPKVRFWRGIFCSAPPLGCGIHSRLGSVYLINSLHALIKFDCKLIYADTLPPLSQPARHKSTPLSAVNFYCQCLL